MASAIDSLNILPLLSMAGQPLFLGMKISPIQPLRHTLLAALDWSTAAVASIPEGRIDTAGALRRMLRRCRELQDDRLDSALARQPLAAKHSLAPKQSSAWRRLRPRFGIM